MWRQDYTTPWTLSVYPEHLASNRSLQDPFVTGVIPAELSGRIMRGEVGSGRLEHPENRSYLAGWIIKNVGNKRFHLMRFDRETSTSPRPSATDELRVLCHFLIDQLPDISLAELHDELSAFARAYPERPQLPMTRDLRLEQSTVLQVESTVVRPVPNFDEEE